MAKEIIQRSPNALKDIAMVTFLLQDGRNGVNGLNAVRHADSVSRPGQENATGM